MRARCGLLLGLAMTGMSCSEIAVPTGPSTAATETFASQLGIGGTATRSFVVHETGTVSVTLTSAGPPDSVVLGLGIGIPMASGSGCNLSQSVVTAAATRPQLNVTADAGNYCVRVSDAGNLTGNVSFSVSVLHP